VVIDRSQSGRIEGMLMKQSSVQKLLPLLQRNANNNPMVQARACDLVTILAHRSGHDSNLASAAQREYLPALQKSGDARVRTAAERALQTLQKRSARARGWLAYISIM
jgi:hypothetical protein